MRKGRFANTAATKLLHAVSAALILLFGLVFVCMADGQPAGGGLDIVTASNTWNFTVEPITEKHKDLLNDTRGVSGSHGLLFMVNAPQQVVMGSQGADRPLDLFFVTEQRAIIHIEENARPTSVAPVLSGVPVIAVLEVAAA